jgi:cation diffusion facilitator CzcD-associated flavoprotein CzcO
MGVLNGSADWSSFYAEGPEIWEYIKKTTVKYGLDEKVQFNSKVVESIWDDESGKWNIQIERQDGSVQQDQADVLINGSGILNKWRWPAIKGLDTFSGKLVHSAAWDSQLSWEGKRVALIGNGSSAIQILPQMQRTAAHVTTYIRSATWISSNYAADKTQDGKNFKYTERQKEEFRNDPEKLKALRKDIEHGFNMFFYALLNENPAQAAIYDAFKQKMTERLNGDPELCAKLIPEWRVGCRRLTPGDGYLEALQEPNVSIQFNEIVEITPEGIRTQEGVEEFDIIVCATGFDVSFSPYWHLLGKNGVDLGQKWADSPVSSTRTLSGQEKEMLTNVRTPILESAPPTPPITSSSTVPILPWDTGHFWLSWIGRPTIY